MYRKILFLFIGVLVTGFIFMSCSDDSSTDPAPIPKCTIVSPNGGDIVQMGQTVWVHFDNELTEAVAIHVYKGQDSIDVVDPMITASDSIQWLIPTAYDEGFDYRLKIVSTEDPAKYDFSDANFTIAPANNYIMVSSPNGGGIWLKGSTTTINWITNIAGTVRIDLYKNGAPELVIYNSQINDGSQGWTIPGTLDDSADYQIQIQSIETPAIFDDSDTFFCLATNDNTQNVIGDWNATGTWAKWDTVLDFKSNGTWENVLYAADKGTWTMSGNGLKMNFEGYTRCFLAIVDGNDIDGTMAEGSATGIWSAERVIPELLAPNGGEVWMRGTTQTITWDSSITGNVVLSLADSTGVIQNIATVAGSLGTYAWAIPTNINPDADYMIRIAKEINDDAKDESDHYFVISANETVDIIGEWKDSFTHTKADFSMVFNSNGTGTWNYIGTYSGTWTLTGNGMRFNFDSYPDTYFIAIVSGDKMKGTFVDDAMKGIWSGQRLLNVTTPNGGNFFQPADVVSITWNETLTADNVTIDLYENDLFYRNIGTVNINNYTSFNWTVPSNVVTSTKYKIRLTSTTSDIYDESDSYFTIDGVPATPAIEDDTFNDGLAQNWTGVDGIWTVVDSVYTVSSGTFNHSSAVLDSTLTGNYVVEAKMKKITGSNIYYGILFNGDNSTLMSSGYWDDGSMLLISTTGSYGFWTCNNSSWVVSTGFISNTAVNAGLDAWNVLKVIVDNSTGDHHIFINGQYMQTINSTYLTGGKIGLSMWDDSTAGTAAVDYIKVSSVNKADLKKIKLIRNTDIDNGAPVVK